MPDEVPHLTLIPKRFISADEPDRSSLHCLTVLDFQGLNSHPVPYFIDSGIESFILCCIGGTGSKTITPGDKEWISCS
jgi:hypothetical protein